jgi:hypothetical protein
MAIVTGLLIGLAAASTALQARGQYKAGKAARKEGEYNARVSEEQAADAIARGEETVTHVASQGKLLTGAQRASLAAQGIDIDSGSASDVISNDQRLTGYDIAQVRLNAQREAHGLTTQAEGYRAAGRSAAAGYQNQMYGTLIAGAADLFTIYQRYGLNRSTSGTVPTASTGAQGTTGGLRAGTAHY